MQFNSIPFLIFLFIIVVLYYLIPQKYKKPFLLLSSYYFYFSAKPEYLVLLLASTAINYLTAYLLETKQSRKTLLVLNLAINLGILFGFKYLNFVSNQLNSIFRQFSLNLHIPTYSIILPIGISFYTIMAIGYILDIYWGDRKRDKNYILFSLYMAFFPQILSGPIGRAKNLIPQFLAKQEFRYDNFSNGFRLMLWGYFKKMVIADNIGVYVDRVFDNIPVQSSLTAILTMMLYGFQLYADFSGYTDIARGTARLFGIKLMVNFKSPYLNSTSITDFWRRNHISLTSWLRDYVFYPFIGTNPAKWNIYTGLLIMFLLSGIWHGAGWMFIIWGAYQAVLLIFEDLTGLSKAVHVSKFNMLLRKGVTLALVSFGLLFFRLPDLSTVGKFIHVLFSNSWTYFAGTTRLIPPMLISLPLFLLIEIWLNKEQFDTKIGNLPLVMRWITYLSLIFIIVIFGNLNGSSFIYYNF